MINTFKNSALIVMLFILSHCNNSSTGEEKTHSTSAAPDTASTIPIIREGGVQQDSIQTGATDTTFKKDSSR